MDSPIFGSQRPNQANKNRKTADYLTANTEINPLEWYVTNKTGSASGTSQISNDLKLAYTLLVVEKNIKSLFSKLNLCLNKKKNQAFNKIVAQYKKASQKVQKSHKQHYKSGHQTVNNPQIRPLAIICTVKVNEHLASLCRIAERLNFKKIMKAWTNLYINMQKSHLPMVMNDYSSCLEPDLGICSKIEGKKNLNSKKHAREMKENSILNHTNSDFELDNQKMMAEVINSDKMLDIFTEKMNAILAIHEQKFPTDSDRETLLSENGISHSSLQHHTKARKNNHSKKR